MKFGIKSLQDFVAFLVRRRWWVLVPFVALSCVLAILTKYLPRIYVSEALVLVQPRDVPENFVMDLVSRSPEQRLKSIQQMVLSRNNLTAVLLEFKDELPEYQNLTQDAAIERLRHEINITFGVEPNATGGRDVTSFRIAYQHKHPEVAKNIASKLTELFIAADKTNRSKHVSGTTAFLSTELQKKDLLLEESEKNLKSLKSGHQNELPQQLENNQRTLDRLYDDKKANREALDRRATERVSIQNILTNVQEYLPVVVQRAPTLPMQQDSEEKDPDVEAYLTAKKNYESIRSQFPNDGYPDVARAKLLMERAKEKVPPAALEAVLKPKPKSSAPAQPAFEEKKVQNPQWVALQNALNENETETKILLADKSRIEDDILRVTRRVENTPQVELQLSEVTRENAELRKQREGLNSDLTKAQLSESLETRGAGAQFQVVDEANLPLDAAKPNKVVVLLVACLFSLVLAIAFALVVDVATQKVWTQAEIESMWGVPVMVDIPAIVTDGDQDVLRKKRMSLVAVSLVFILVYGVCLYGVYLKHNSILQNLDPVLQRVVYR
jgi:uncharacterized protein involved in exopolysaccharide biosynthesis